MDDKEASGATMQEVENLAEYAGFVPGTQGFMDFKQGAGKEPCRKHGKTTSDNEMDKSLLPLED